jgi:hypothetical protein
VPLGAPGEKLGFSALAGRDGGSLSPPCPVKRFAVVASCRNLAPKLPGRFLEPEALKQHALQERLSSLTFSFNTL